MISPRQTKYRKYRKGRIRSELGRFATYGCTPVIHGDYALIAKEGGRLTARQLEAGRRALRRKLNRAGRLWIIVFPDIPVTSKPRDVRMGMGKGTTDYWTVRVRPGQRIFELMDVSDSLAKKALESAAKKFAISTQIVSRPVIL